MNNGQISNNEIHIFIIDSHIKQIYKTSIQAESELTLIQEGFLFLLLSYFPGSM